MTDVLFLTHENVRLKASNRQLELLMIDMRGEIDRLRMAEKKQKDARYLAYQLTDGAKP